MFTRRVRIGKRLCGALRPPPSASFPADLGFALQLVPPVGTSATESMPLSLPLLHAFAATELTTQGASNDADCTDFPGEHPTDKDLSDWLDAVVPRL